MTQIIRCPHGCDDTITTLRAEVEMQAELIERLKMEARIHHDEAQTANSTIAEIYQVVTGSKGEPGNWNGAAPVRALMARAEKLEAFHTQMGKCSKSIWRSINGEPAKQLIVFIRCSDASDQASSDAYRAALTEGE